MVVRGKILRELASNTNVYHNGEWSWDFWADFIFLTLRLHKMHEHIRRLQSNKMR